MESFTVIIPTLEEEGFVKNILQDIKKQTVKPDQVLVIDAKSQDNTIKEAIKYGADTVIAHPPVGYQRKVGGEMASSDTLIFFDADVRISNDFFEKALKEFERREVDIACTIYWTRSAKIHVKIFIAFLNLIFYITQNIYPSGSGPCIIVKKDVFIKHGGFIPECTFDDLEFISRVGQAEKFAFFTIPIYISDRRFRKQGFIKTFKAFSKIAYSHIKGELNQSDHIKYEFGGYERIKNQN